MGKDGRENKVTKTETINVKKIFAVAAALLLGFLLPYLSRIPLAFTYGAAWIWKYISHSGDFVRWNGFHLFSLIPILIFGLLFVFGISKWSFYAGVGGHFAVTFLIYYNFEEHYGVDDFLGCILFPLPIAAASFLCGMLVLAAELYFNRAKPLE